MQAPESGLPVIRCYKKGFEAEQPCVNKWKMLGSEVGV